MAKFALQTTAKTIFTLMRINLFIKSSVLTGAVAAAATFSSCHGHDDDHEHGHAHGHDVEPTEEAEELHTPGGGALVHLDSIRADRLGVKVSVVAPDIFYETIAVGGRLEDAPGQQSVVTARSAGIVRLVRGIAPGAEVRTGQTIATVSGSTMAGGDSNEASPAALRAAARELERLKPLHAEGIVSTREYNAALQAYESALAAAGKAGEGSGTTAVAATDGVITSLSASEGQYVDAGAPIATVSGIRQITLRADLPERYLRFLPSDSGSMIRTPYAAEARAIRELNGRRISGSTPAGAAGYVPVYFMLDNDGTLTPGSNCEITLLGGERQGVVSVPLASLTEQQGQMFVFVRLDDEHYEKRPVTLGAKAGDRVEIVSRLTPGEIIVTEGTPFVKLAESAGAAVPGHTHNH